MPAVAAWPTPIARPGLLPNHSTPSWTILTLYEFKRPDKRRPVLVLTRQEVIPLLRTAMVAPITSAIRGVPSEVIVGVNAGLKNDSAVNLDHVQTVEQARLSRYVGHVDRHKMRHACRATAVAVGCDDSILIIAVALEIVEERLLRAAARPAQ